jgi:putative ABC transport system permease protein
METFVQDLRYGFRVLRKSPGFTVVAVITLALGIGANTAVFSALDALVFRPLPVKAPGELVHIFTSYQTGLGEDLLGETSHPDLQDYREATGFAGIAGYDRRGMIMRLGEESAGLPAAVVTGNYFSLLGISALHGRLFGEEEFRAADAPAVIVVSHHMWQRYLGGDARAIGRQLLLNNRPFLVLGVLPKDFRSTEPLYAPEIFVPAEVWGRGEMVERENARLYLVGRLRPDVDVSQGRAQLDTIAQGLAEAYPKWRRGRVITVCSQYDCGGGGRPAVIRGEVQTAAGIQAVALMVLLIAATNVAALMMARGESRRREVATRMSIGASRSRIAGQLMTEGLLLAALGLLAAVLVAAWIVSFLPGLLPPDFETIADFRIDARVLLFASVGAMLSVVVFALAPALQSGRGSLVSDLKEGSATGTGPARILTRTALIVGQIAVSFVLLTCAGLLVRTFFKAQERQSLGFDPLAQVLLLEIKPGLAGSAKNFFDHHQDLLAGVEAIAGVERASFATRAPFSDYGGGAFGRVYLPGMQLAPNETGVRVNFDVADGNYFQVLGTRLLRGRTFDSRDQSKSPRVAILNETAARRFWPSLDPVGQHFRFGLFRGGSEGDDYEVVGIIEDGKYSRTIEATRPQIFVPFTQYSLGDVMLLVRTSVPPESVAPAVRRRIRDFDNQMPVLNIITLRSHMRFALSEQRLLVQVVAGLGLLGLTLAVIGLYGVLAYYVGRSRHEIGVRLAIGAEPASVFRMVVRRGLLLASIGIAIGAVMTIAVTQLMQELLYRVSPRDPVTLAAVALMLAGVAALSACIPARRAARVDPVNALRCE